MLLTNAGVSVPPLSASPLNAALLDPARVTVTTYTFFVVPSCAVTVVVIRFAPTASAHAAGVPAQPLYATVAFAWLFVPVIVTLLTAFATLAA